MEDIFASLKEMEWDGIIPEEDIISHSTPPVCAFMPKTKEWRQRISEANMGKVFTEKHKENLSKSSATKGKKLSEETRMKMSESRMGRKLSEETKRKISEKHKGRVHTKQARKNMSEGWAKKRGGR